MNSICLLGQDLATDGKALYASGATKYLAPGGSLDGFEIPVPGFGVKKFLPEKILVLHRAIFLLAERWKLNNLNLSSLILPRAVRLLRGLITRCSRIILIKLSSMASAKENTEV